MKQIIQIKNSTCIEKSSTMEINSQSSNLFPLRIFRATTVVIILVNNTRFVLTALTHHMTFRVYAVFDIVLINLSF